MSEPIKVGDLVMVVRNDYCGCSSTKLGAVFRVSKFKNKGSYCIHCLRVSAKEPLAMGLEDFGVPLFRLKRIPPYNQLEHFRTEELLRRDVKEKA